MIRAVIIEDERLIANELSVKLASLPSPVEVMAILGSVKESLEFFSDGCHALRGVAQKICILSVGILEMSNTNNLRAQFI